MQKSNSRIVNYRLFIHEIVIQSSNLPEIILREIFEVNTFPSVSPEELARVTDAILKTISPREERVIRLRFGLDEAGQRRTMEQIGGYLGVTRQRISQMLPRILRKLRYPGRLRLFLKIPWLD
jgi:RNA polymerase sigma factor (sigma-70 family)